MRAFVVNRQLTQLMQAADMFSENKVVYAQLDLGYILDDNEVTNEELISIFAKAEFSQDLIMLCGKDKPLYINPGIQVISTGRGWSRLWDVVTKLYPDIEFQSDDYFTNIQIKQL